MARQVIFFVYLHVKERKWVRVIQMLGLVFLVGIGASAAIRVILLSQAFRHPNVPLKDSGERD
ncbi:hypothetical protein LOCC1_G006471 [Lachnellula occidentalis]|uniref:Uncharacterized protein n=1 Tax=Lachnellula occidentalis TaxID=215460 RepID=A0A8H8RV88_9HELO|nr:hypothetical protein LOCC1_G006471 [Lachnellula occidentalis]